MKKHTIYFLFFLILISSTYATNEFNITNCQNYPGIDSDACYFLTNAVNNSNYTQNELLEAYFSLTSNPFQILIDWNQQIASWFKTTPTNVTYYNQSQIENAWIKIISIDPTLIINKKEYIGNQKATITTEYGYQINTKKYENTTISKNQKICSVAPKLGTCRINKKTTQTKELLEVKTNNKTIGISKQTTIMPEEENNIQSILTINQNTTYENYIWSGEQGCKKKTYCKITNGKLTCESKCYCYYYTCQYDHLETKTDELQIEDKQKITKSLEINTENTIKYSKTPLFKKQEYQNCTNIKFDNYPVQKTTCQSLKIITTSTFFITNLIIEVIKEPLNIEKNKTKDTYDMYLTINQTNLKSLDLEINNKNISFDLGKLSYTQNLFGKTTAIYNETFKITNGEIYVLGYQKNNDKLTINLKMILDDINSCQLIYNNYFNTKIANCNITPLSNAVIELKTDKIEYSDGENIQLTIKTSLENKPLNEKVIIIYGNRSLKEEINGEKTINVPFKSGINTLIVSNIANIYKGQTTEKIIINDKPGRDLVIIKTIIIIALIIIGFIFGMKYLIKKHLIYN